MTKATFGKHDGQSFAYRIEGVTPSFHTAPFGRTLDEHKKAKAFREHPETKHTCVGAKGKATLAAVKKWVKENQIDQFWANWKSDSSNYKNDSVPIYYTRKIDEYETRVQQLENEGMTRSDAQSRADLEINGIIKWN